MLCYVMYVSRYVCMHDVWLLIYTYTYTYVWLLHQVLKTDLQLQSCLFARKFSLDPLCPPQGLSVGKHRSFRFQYECGMSQIEGWPTGFLWRLEDGWRRWISWRWRQWWRYFYIFLFGSTNWMATLLWMATRNHHQVRMLETLYESWDEACTSLNWFHPLYQVPSVDLTRWRGHGPLVSKWWFMIFQFAMVYYQSIFLLL